MGFRRSYLFVLALVITAGMVLTACSGLYGGGGTDEGQVPEPAQQEPPKELKGEIVYGFTGDPLIFNPILSTDVPSAFINDRVYSGLVKYDENLELVPDLATSWSYSDDGLEWTFKLRDDVTWHDGEKFTASDVRYTLMAIKDPNYSGVRGSAFQPLQDVQVIDDTTVKLVLSEPFAPFLSQLTIGIIPEHLFSSTTVEDMRENEANQRPVGTGPYMWGEWVKGQYLVLEANPNYYREGPWVKTVRVRFYQDSQVMVAALENGEIDFMDDIPADDVDHLKEALAASYNFYQFPNNGYTYIGLKQTHPILKDKRVRQATMYGIDRKSIVEDVFNGLATVMNSHFPPISWAHTDDINTYDYNPDKAQALLEEAGWTTVGEDGIRLNDNGDRLEFSVLTATGNKESEAVLSRAQSQLKDVGLSIVPQFFEFTDLVEQHLNVGKFEAYMLGWSLGLDPDPYIFFHSDSAEMGPDGRLKGFNDVEIRNEELDQLIEEGRQTLDRAQRKQIYYEISKLLNEEVPYVWLYTKNSVTAMNKKFQGVRFSPLGPINPEEWYIVEPK